MRNPATLPTAARRAIASAFALLDSVAFVTQPGDTARPVLALRRVLDSDDKARAALARRADATQTAANGPQTAPDWQAIAAQHARQRDAAMAQRDAAARDFDAMQAQRDSLQRAFDDRTEALRIAGDALATVSAERDALRRELRFANLAEDGTQKKNTAAARVLRASDAAAMLRDLAAGEWVADDTGAPPAAA